jgi:hypothetical protein
MLHCTAKKDDFLHKCFDLPLNPSYTKFLGFSHLINLATIQHIDRLLWPKYDGDIECRLRWLRSSILLHITIKPWYILIWEFSSNFCFYSHKHLWFINYAVCWFDECWNRLKIRIERKLNVSFINKRLSFELY